MLMFWHQEVLVAILLEEFAGIDEEHTAIFLGTLLQHDDTGSDTYTKEKIGWQLYDSIHIVILNKILTDALLVTSTIKHARELYDGCCSLLRQMIEHVHRKSQIGCTFGSQNASRRITRVVYQDSIVFAFPFQ